MCMPKNRRSDSVWELHAGVLTNTLIVVAISILSEASSVSPVKPAFL